MSEVTLTERGFEVFADFRDAYGSRIRVQRSSHAMYDAVWIFCDDNPTMADPAPHLTVEQAREVRDALNEFIKRYETPDPTFPKQDRAESGKP